MSSKAAKREKCIVVSVPEQEEMERMLVPVTSVWEKIVGPYELKRVLIGGAFGQYIDVEAAISIGLLPDIPWDRFRFPGNTSVAGAYQCLASRERRRCVDEIGAAMTYLGLSAGKQFMDAFTATMFLPHTDITCFPSARELLSERLGSETG